MSVPFRQGRFADLPELPRVPHVFAQTTRRLLTIEAPGWPRGTPAAVHSLGAGPPLLLVHGLMTSAYSFRYALAPLAQHFTCHALDLPGAGDTPPANDTPHDAASLGRFVVGVQRALGAEGCACVANSMGGYVAMVAALDHGPGTFSRLVNVHSPGVPLARLAALSAAWSLPGSERLLHALVGLSPERWCHRNVHYLDESLKSLEEARTYAAPLRAPAGVTALGKYLSETLRHADLARFEARLARRRDAGEPFPVPLQLLYARRDPMVPPVVGERLRALIPSADFRWIEQASHFMHVDALDRFLAAALPFLQASA